MHSNTCTTWGRWSSRMRCRVTGLEFLNVSEERNAFIFKGWEGPTRMLYISSKCLKWLILVLLLFIIIIIIIIQEFD